MFCTFCGKEHLDSIIRDSTCESCGRDLKICLHCIFFKASAYNGCLEPQAERVTDKERRNFCEYFKPSSKKSLEKNSQELLKNAELLFRKKK